jgi:hypothetical protein
VLVPRNQLPALKACLDRRRLKHQKQIAQWDAKGIGVAFHSPEQANALILKFTQILPIAS